MISIIVDSEKKGYSKIKFIKFLVSLIDNLSSLWLYIYQENKLLRLTDVLFNTVRLAPEEDSVALTGFVHNAVTCVGMQTDIPVIYNSYYKLIMYLKA